MQLFLCLLRGLLLLGCVAALRLLLHILSRLLQSARGIGHLPVIVLAREFIELPRQPFGFFLQFLRSHLIAAAATAALLLLASAALLQFLLALGQFLQLPQRFIDILRALLLHFSALDRLVLILVLIEFQFEKIGEIPCVLPAATTAATAAHRHLNLIEQRIRAHQILKRLLLERLGFCGFSGLQLFRRRVHLLNGALQIVRHLLDHLVLIRQAPARHTLDQRVRLFGSFRLICADRVDVIRPFVVLEFVLVVDQLVRRSDDVFLALQ